MSEDTSLGDKNTIDRTQVFAVYNVYRLVIGSVLFALTLSDTGSGLLSDDIALQTTGAGIFVISSLIIARLGFPSKLTTEGGIFGVMMMDVVAITLVADPSTSLISGFTVLYLVTVAAAGILLASQQLAILVAAVATVATLSDTLFFKYQGSSDAGVLLYAGVRGAAVFLVCWVAQAAAAILTKAEQRATEAANEAQHLKLFTDQIVEHMQTGILLVTPNNDLKPINSAASDLLMLDSDSSISAEQVDPQLAMTLLEWRDGNTLMPSPFKPEKGHRILLPRFTTLEPSNNSDALLFLDDYTPMIQFAQALKLNSLGRLTGSIAHEIRNPLAAVSNAVQLLAENESMSEGDRELANIIVRNTARMNETVSSVLELSRRTPPNSEPIDIEEWISIVINEYKEAISHDSILSFTGSCPCPVIADKKQLKRVLDNLIDNALRHSEAKTGARTAQLHVSRNDNQHLCYIDVIDDGEGVPESVLSRLFEPFFTTRPEGTGLGLYLCKELCESNGAEISYRRTHDGRSSFRLSLRMQSRDPQ